MKKTSSLSSFLLHNLNSILLYLTMCLLLFYFIIPGFIGILESNGIFLYDRASAISRIFLYKNQFPVYNEDIQRKQAIKEAFLHAYNAYKRKCWTYDEYDVSSDKCHHTLYGGLTIIESLSTLYIMGLEEELLEARDYLKNVFMPTGTMYSFEFVIRVIGGFMSAYHLTGDRLYLKYAVRGAEILYKHRTINGFFPSVMVYSSELKILSGFCMQDIGSLADVGTFSLEFFALSEATGKDKYLRHALKAYGSIWDRFPDGELLDDDDYKTETKTGAKHLSAHVDSYYEYLSKIYIMSRGVFTKAFDMHRRAVRDIKNSLLFHTRRNKLFGIGQIRLGRFIPLFDHLSFFVPGMLQIGSVRINPYADEDSIIARELVETIHYIYNSSNTGLAGETTHFKNAIRFNSEFTLTSPVKRAESISKTESFTRNCEYMLRPEAIESIFYTYRFTGDNKYRDYNWDIFLALNKTARFTNGFGHVMNVTDTTSAIGGIQDSYLFSEVFKYLYLTYESSNVLHPTEWVFNTQGHPLRIWRVATVKKFKRIINEFQGNYEDILVKND